MTAKRWSRVGRRTAPSLLLLVALVAGCDSTTGPDERRVLGTLLYEDGEAAVTAPETAEAGEPFTVTVTTFWTDGCAELDETEVRATTTEVHVIPWDRVTEPSDDTTCDLSTPTFEHSVTLSRASPAELTLIVHGRRLEEGGARTEVTVRRALVIEAP